MKKVWCIICQSEVKIPKEEDTDFCYCPVCGNWDTLIDFEGTEEE